MIFIALTFCLAGRRFIHLLTPVPLPKLPLSLFLSLVWRFCSIHIYGWATLCRIFHSIVLVFISFICHFCLYSRYCCCLRLFVAFLCSFRFFRSGCLQLLNGLSYCGNFLYAPTRFDGFYWRVILNTLIHWQVSLSFSHRHRERGRATNTQSKNVK